MKTSIPIAGLVTLLAFFIIESFSRKAEFHTSAAPSFADQLIASKSHLVSKRKVGPQDVIFLGDSFAATGVDASTLSQNLAPTRLYNLSLVASASFGGNYYLVKEYLENNPAPKAAIFLVTRNGLSMSLAKVILTRRLARYFNSPDILLDAFPILGLEGTLDALYWWLFPSHNSNSLLRDFPPGWTQGWGRIEKVQKKRRKLLKNTERAKGFTGVNEKKMRVPHPKGVRIKRGTSLYLDKTLDLLSQKGVKTYCAAATIPLHAYDQMIETTVGGPVKKTLTELRAYWRRKRVRWENRNRGRELITSLNSLADLQSRGCELLDTPAAFEKHYFGSLTHFNISGATAFAETMTRYLPERLPALFDSGDKEEAKLLCKDETPIISSKQIGTKYIYTRLMNLNGSAIAWKLPAYLKGKRISVEYLAPEGTRFSMNLRKDFQTTETLQNSEVFSVESACSWKQWTPEKPLHEARVITISLDKDLSQTHSLFLQDSYERGGQLYGMSALATIYAHNETSGESSTRQSPLVSNIRISVLD